MNQTDIFSFLEEETEQYEEAVQEAKPYFDRGDLVKVKDADDVYNIEDTEDYYYLKGFSNRKGVIYFIEIVAKQKVIYHVTFTDKKETEIGIFYEDDLVNV